MPKPFQGRPQRHGALVEHELSLDPDLELATALIELPVVEAAVGRQAMVDADAGRQVLGRPRLRTTGELGGRGDGSHALVAPDGDCDHVLGHHAAEHANGLGAKERRGLPLVIDKAYYLPVAGRGVGRTPRRTDHMSDVRDVAQFDEVTGLMLPAISVPVSPLANLFSSTKQPHPLPRTEAPLFGSGTRSIISASAKTKKAAKRDARKNALKYGVSLPALPRHIRTGKSKEAIPRTSPAPPVIHPVPSGVDGAWARLGQDLGFIPVWNEVAVIEYRTPTYRGVVGTIDDAPRRAGRLRELLSAKGVDDFTLVVAVPKLPAAETDLICDDDTYVVEVPDTFWVQDAGARIATCRELVDEPRGIDQLLPGLTADDMKLTDRTVGEFSGRNPDLDEQDVEDWRRRVFDTARVA